MASSPSSPVLVQHVHPPITFTPDVSLVPVPNMSTESQREESAVPVFQISMEEPSAQSGAAETVRVEEGEADTPMADAPASITQPDPRQEAQNPSSELSSSHQPSQAEDASAPPDGTPLVNPDPQSHSVSAEQTPAQPEPSPPPPRPAYPEWVTWEDDISTPTEEELKEMQGSEESALDVPSIEKKVYEDWDDPEQRPVKKIRLSWVIKGVRGTKECPNMARTMNSPCALIDGHYWQIKFFPRGNKSSSISAYIRCTKRQPTPDAEVPESTFSYFEGPPDADMGAGAEPKKVVHVPATLPKQEKGCSKSLPDEPSASRADHGALTADAPNSGTAEGESSVAGEVKAEPPADEDYRIPAQLGMVIYNPAEPRTCSFNSSEHQFTKHNDDWGWTHFVGPWNEIHIRQRGQRQALLKNDTIVVDAYIRIFEDPSQALWWHVSHEHEAVWPSKKLAGYFPMGTPQLYHSPAVAGITAWLLLAPFRKVLEGVDAGEWRQDSQVRPRPLIARLQVVLHLMRHLKREDYVNVNPVVEALRESGETFNDVKSFWEAFRRSIEIELEGEEDALRQLRDILDTSNGFCALPSLPVKGVENVQSALKAVTIPKQFESSPPNFLPLMLEREIFDKQACEWKLCHDRVALDDEISLPNGEKYILYGFMVHVGARNSGKFYSILRPNGLGTKWLAFEDGDGNKVFSYTRKRIRDYEGLTGDELKNFKSTRRSAYMAIYIKRGCAESYLPGKLEDYCVPLSLRAVLDQPEFYDEEFKKLVQESEETQSVEIEVYSDDGVLGRQGLLDMFNVKQQTLAQGHFWKFCLPRGTKFQALRQTLTSQLGLDSVEKMRLFIMNYGDVGQYTSAQWEPVSLAQSLGEQCSLRRPMCLWLSILKNEEDIIHFGVPDPPEVGVQEEKGTEGPRESGLDANAGNATEHNPAANSTDTALTESAANDAQQQSAAHTPSSPEAIMEDVPADPAASEPAAATEGTTMATSEPVPEAALTTVSEPIDTDQPLPVEHGHLFDAVMSEALGIPPMDSATIIETTISGVREGQNQASQQATANLDEAAIAELIAADVEIMEVLEQSDTQNNRINPAAESANPEDNIDEMVQDPASNEATPLAEAEPNAPTRPAPNVYGFLQVFDADTQNFTVHSTFFGKRDESAKDVVRKCMGFETDKEFHAWHRETTLDGAAIDGKATFNDINFSDGVDIIVGEILSDAKKEELRQQGKFSSPFALSRYLRMAERRHPVLARTTTEPVEIADFGMNYYKGPLVNGQPHGEKCLMITSHGHTYEGPLVMNEKSGANGKMTYQNGDVYEGEWKNDERHGRGTFTEKRTGNKYVGGFQNGKRWGKGLTHWEVADEEAEMCQICYGEEINALFFDCGHVCSCVECAKQCEVCPICRRTVQQVVRMFWA